MPAPGPVALEFCHHLNKCGGKGKCVSLGYDKPEVCVCSGGYEGDRCEIAPPLPTSFDLKQVAEHRRVVMQHQDSAAFPKEVVVKKAEFDTTSIAEVALGITALISLISGVYKAGKFVYKCLNKKKNGDQEYEGFVNPNCEYMV